MRTYSRFTFFENTINNLQKTPKAKFQGGEGFFCFVNRFGSFQITFTTTNSLSKFYFRFRWFILLLQMEKVIFMNYNCSINSWKPWRRVRLDQIFSMRGVNIISNLTSLAKFTSSSRITKFKDTLPWNILQMITNTIAISRRIVISFAMKRGISFWVWWKVNENRDDYINFLMKGKSLQGRY